MNNFIWFRFNPNEQLWKDKSLSNADIGRIVYLGTQIDYKNNIIFNNNEPITKKNMNCLVNMSRAGFELFFKKLIDNEILYMPDDFAYKDYNYILNKTIYNNLMLNKDIIRKGTSNKYWNNQRYTERIKLYNGAIKNLVDDNISFHKIGSIMRLVPYLDYRNNSIHINDAMRILDYDKEKEKRFTEAFSNIPYINIEKSYFSVSKKLLFYKGVPTKSRQK